MKRQDIIKAIADTSVQLTQADASQILSDIEGLIASSLITSGEYTLQGLGKLKVKERSARQGRNPKTGETVEIPAKKTVTFAPAKALKEVLNP